MPVRKPKTKILLDGGDPEETQRVRDLLGFLDGQTTNPTYVAKNPSIQRQLKTGHKLSWNEQNEVYKHIVEAISPLVGEAGVSIEVFADFTTKAEQMLAQGKEMYSWIPNAYIKYPCIPEGMKAARMSVQDGMRVNMTLCFSQEQAAAVYAATKGAREPVYVSRQSSEPGPLAGFVRVAGRTRHRPREAPGTMVGRGVPAARPKVSLSGCGRKRQSIAADRI